MCRHSRDDEAGLDGRALRELLGILHEGVDLALDRMYHVHIHGVAQLLVRLLIVLTEDIGRAVQTVNVKRLDASTFLRRNVTSKPAHHWDLRHRHQGREVIPALDTNA